jgi:hypothetical protein
MGIGRAARGILEDLVAKVPGAIDAVGAELSAGFPEALFEQVTGGLRRAAEQLAGVGTE